MDIHINDDVAKIKMVNSYMKLFLLVSLYIIYHFCDKVKDHHSY